MKSINKLVLLIFLFALPLYSLAWGVLGHRIVGEIASRYLTDKARAEIQKILGNESIAISSNWADFIKSDSTYRYLNSWHYINFKGGLSGDEVQRYMKQDTATDVYTRVNFLVKELKRKALPLEQKQLYLRLLIHFIGDIHPALARRPADDLGGNRVRVMWFGTGTNLHAVWDESLVNFQQ